MNLKKFLRTIWVQVLKMMNHLFLDFWCTEMFISTKICNTRPNLWIFWAQNVIAFWSQSFSPFSRSFLWWHLIVITFDFCPVPSLWFIKKKNEKEHPRLMYSFQNWYFGIKNRREEKCINIHFVGKWIEKTKLQSYRIIYKYIQRKRYLGVNKPKFNIKYTRKDHTSSATCFSTLHPFFTFLPTSETLKLFHFLCTCLINF